MKKAHVRSKLGIDAIKTHLTSGTDTTENLVNAGVDPDTGAVVLFDW